jgi:hypothetical protein
LTAVAQSHASAGPLYQPSERHVLADDAVNSSMSADRSIYAVADQHELSCGRYLIAPVRLKLSHVLPGWPCRELTQETLICRSGKKAEREEPVGINGCANF